MVASRSIDPARTNSKWHIRAGQGRENQAALLVERPSIGRRARRASSPGIDRGPALGMARAVANDWRSCRQAESGTRVKLGTVQMTRFAGNMPLSPFAPRKEFLPRSERR